VFAACGDDETASTTTAADSGTTTDKLEAPATITEGALTVCSDIPYAPFQFEGDDGEFTGYDIDLLREVASLGGLTLEVKDVDFDGILGNLAAGNCDVIGSALTITDERAEQVDFTDPYYDSKQSLLVGADSGIETLDDVTGTIGVQSGTTGETYALANVPDGVDVKSFDGADALFAALEGDDITAILQDLPVNVDRARQDDSISVVEEYQTEEQYGFAVEKGNSEVLAFLNVALAELGSNGTKQSIYDTYFAVDGGE